MADDVEAGRGLWSDGAVLVEKKDPGTYEERLGLMKRNLQDRKEAQRRVDKSRQNQEDELARQWEEHIAAKREQAKKELNERLSQLKKAPKSRRGRPGNSMTAAAALSTAVSAASNSGVAPGSGASFLAASPARSGASVFGGDQSAEREGNSDAKAAAGEAVGLSRSHGSQVDQAQAAAAGAVPVVHEEAEGSADAAGDEGEPVSSATQAEHQKVPPSKRATRFRKTEKVETDARDLLPSGQKLAFHGLMTALCQTKEEALRKAIASQAAAPPSRQGTRSSRGGQEGAAPRGMAADEEPDPEELARRRVVAAKERSLARRHRLRRMHDLAHEVLSCRSECLKAFTHGDSHVAPHLQVSQVDQERASQSWKPATDKSAVAAAAAARLMALGDGTGGSMYWHTAAPQGVEEAAAAKSSSHEPSHSPRSRSSMGGSTRHSSKGSQRHSRFGRKSASKQKKRGGLAGDEGRWLSDELQALFAKLEPQANSAEGPAPAKPTAERFVPPRPIGQKPLPPLQPVQGWAAHAQL
eukprot:TRINITY_DN16566_c0_g1_i1.p1 TRINITY_DN16566_c0_g1~~TRINITY_DN16566_c0_g1_i1.p1  ORF type:complete len:526 (-),score=136.03 TRINITY_DN16566_c0_g1_i1:257-1834(-)